MEEEIVEEGGITIGQIFRTIFSEKWLALIIAVAITVIGTIGLYFIGKRREVYSVSFVLQLPGEDSTSSAQYTYPDGSSFYYTDLVSPDNLKEVASREGFTGVNVDKIVKKGDISVSLADFSNGVVGLKYTINVKAKYFKSESAARCFIEELISLPIEHIGSMNINYDHSFTDSKEAITYDEQLTLLKRQATYIQSKYTSLIKTYGEVVVKDGKTLSYYQTRLQTFLDRGDIERLKTTALEKSYVMGDENGQPLAAAIAKYTAEKADKMREKEILSKALDEAMKALNDTLKDQSASVIVDTSAILSYTEQIARLEQEIKEIEAFLDDGNGGRVNAEFENEVTAVEAQVEAFTNEFAEVSSKVYQNKSTVSFLSTRVVEVSGGKGIVMSTFVSLVLGIIVAAIVAYIVGWSKLRKAVSSQSEEQTPADKDTE